MMERVSDSSEDPFEGGLNDIPVFAMCRSIEIDLQQALGEENLPAMHEPIDDVLYLKHGGVAKARHIQMGTPVNCLTIERFCISIIH